MQDFAQTTVPSPAVPQKKGFPNVSLLLRETIAKKNLFRLLTLKKIGTYLFMSIVALALVGALRLLMIRPTTSAQVQGTSIQTQTAVINREFSFQVYDKEKQLADPIRYILTDAQLTNRIVIKGQAATAVKGRTFLIINLKLVNDTNQSLFLNTRNYIRVQPAGVQDKLAADIHNDTAEVQPDSTKLTRVGLPVDEGIKEFTLFVGEIDGEKEKIDIKF